MDRNRTPNKLYNIDQKNEGTIQARRRDGGTNFSLRIKEQETRLNLHDDDDDDDDDDIFGLCVYVTICMRAGMHYKIKSCWRRNYSKIISNVSAFISPIRLRIIAGDLAGALACVSGWVKTSDS